MALQHVIKDGFHLTFVDHEATKPALIVKVRALISFLNRKGITPLLVNPAGVGTEIFIPNEGREIALAWLKDHSILFE